MSYVDRNLLDGEVVRFRTRLHWRLYMPGLLFSLLVLLPLAVVLAVNDLAVWAIAPVVLAATVLLAAHVRRQSSEFVVTNKRVMIKLGVMTTQSIELLLSKVEGIAVHQGMGGKMFGYGDIVVSGSGGTKETFAGIQQPLEFRRAIQAATDEREMAARG